MVAEVCGTTINTVVSSDYLCFINCRKSKKKIKRPVHLTLEAFIFFPAFSFPSITRRASRKFCLPCTYQYASKARFIHLIAVAN